MALLEKLRQAAADARPGTRVIGIDLGTTNSTVPRSVSRCQKQRLLN
jgi:molecular chaperone DnaK (HSP70)